MNLEQARNNMIEQQIRTWDVLDQQVLNVMATVPRELFVPPAYAGLAFSDTEIPLGFGEVMLQPKVQGRMMQALNLNVTERVLEIGTGSGYGAALLARLAGRVVSIDIRESFITGARSNLATAGCAGVLLDCTDGIAGYAPQAPYDAIMVTGACARMPDAIATQLAPGGRMVVVVGSGSISEALLVTRVGDARFATESLFETQLPWLAGAAPRPQFQF